MFRRANLKLTLFYSLLFLGIFWIFSIGIYFWMDNYFSGSYIFQLREIEGFTIFGDKIEVVAAIAGDVAQQQLRNILIVFNIALVIIVPVVSFMLTRRTFAPVQRIHEQQKQFVSDVAHELRTPLAIMSGELEVALLKDRTGEEYQQVLTSGKQETDRLSGLVENLLFLARSDQGRQTITFEKVDITDLVSGVIARLQPEITAKNISVDFIPDFDPTQALGQPSMLEQLFYNLIHNAVLYTPAEGNVRISLSTNKQHAQIQIQDTGIGISPENQTRIFDRFYRVDASRSKTRGYGLGLAISKSIVELHKGKILVLSAAGQGSTFTVLLPSANS